MEEDKGFTLVELIVVIVVLGIISAVSVYGVASFNSLSSESSLESLATAIDTARYATMSSVDDAVTLVVEDDGNFYHARVLQGGVVSEEYKLGDSRFTMYIDTGSSSTGVVSMEITFNKSDGSYKSIKVNGVEMPLRSSCTISAGNSDSILYLALETGRVQLK